MSIYARADIHDIGAFYASKFVSGSTAHLRPDSSTDAFDIRNSKAIWFYGNIEPGASVLDFGCGGGALAVLKHKGCILTGVELSIEGARAAERAGYDRVLTGDLSELDLPPQSFDYIVSLDVFGHIEFEHKDAVISGLKRLLKPDGVMIHGIEAGKVDYDGMSPEQLRAYVGVDGHVGIEGRAAILDRWRRAFSHVEGELRFVHAKPASDIVKEALEYGDNGIGDLVHLLDQYSDGQRAAFSLAMGMVFRSLEALGTPSGDHGGFMLLRAADRPLPPRTLGSTGFTAPTVHPGAAIPLDHPGLLAGWHSVEGDPIQGIRWAGPQAHILIRLSEPCRELQLEVSSFDAKNHLFAFLPTDKGTPASNIVVGRHRQVFSVPLPREVGRDGPLISLRIDASRFVCPAWTGESPDERRLGFCLHGLRAV